MSMTEVERFSADIRSDEALQDSAKGLGTDVDAFIKLANDKGYDFTKDELVEHAKALSENAETKLDDDDLDKVAGGAIVSGIVDLSGLVQGLI